jgi:hypothetical protein
MLFGFKIKTTITTKSGKEKQATIEYLADVGSFTEAEAIAEDLFNPQDQNSEVVAIYRSPIKEVQERNGSDGKTEDNSFFKVTLKETYLTDNGEEKELKYYVLVAADSVQQANSLTAEYVKQGLEDMCIDGIVKTKIVEYIK